MSSEDLEYFRERAVVERQLAKAAKSEKVRRIHEELARGYDQLVKQEEANTAPTCRVAFPSPQRISA